MYARKENYAHKYVIRYKIGSLLLYTLYWYAYLHVCTIYMYSMPANTNYEERYQQVEKRKNNVNFDNSEVKLPLQPTLPLLHCLLLRKIYGWGNQSGEKNLEKYTQARPLTAVRRQWYQQVEKNLEDKNNNFDINASLQSYDSLNQLAS